MMMSSASPARVLRSVRALRSAPASRRSPVLEHVADGGAAAGGRCEDAFETNLPLELIVCKRLPFRSGFFLSDLAGSECN